ncbi:MAG: glycoside hydrolase family 3 C-terminal domain-containing protein [Slackia sp.]|nr:glycoside hydrolase family 3 C-terminal domain-containing protein [Slackia sp.]
MDIDACLETMTTAEKARLLAGADHWTTCADEAHGIFATVFSDGPHGLRKQEGGCDHLGIERSVPATCFPTASALACSFDESLIEEVGAAIGEEARDQGVDVVLGPGVNMKRSPLCGRNFEYFSEDPLVAGVLGAAMVRGIQSRGVGACVKHFAGNNQEHARMVSDSVIDERALREVYLSAFERVVREARPWAVMTGYNRLNGTYCSENLLLLRDILRDEWGFDGATVTDWGAMSSSAASVAAGLDICMPGPRADHARAIERAVVAGTLSREAVDAAARRVIELSLRARRGRSIPYACDYGRHADVAYRAACESAVLLENDGLLPLAGTERIAVIGSFALLPRYQGAGSSRIEPVCLDDPWSAFCNAGVEATYARGYDPVSGEADEEALDEAARVAAGADVAVVFAGLPDRFESEGFDRKLMVMPRGHRALIERVCAANPRTVVVLQGGSPMEMPWRRLPAAIVLMHLSGCQGGRAAVDLLMGRANPCGKLAETWPERLEDTALGRRFPDTDREVLYRESIYVGYRYFDAAGVQPAYPFGFGRSYTTFSYADPEVHIEDGGYVVSCAVTNTGARAGSETVQLYTALPESRDVREPRRLAAFSKVALDPGESARVAMRIDERAFRVWDRACGSWRVDEGDYELAIGASSRDARLVLRLPVTRGAAPFAVSGPCDRASGMIPEAYLHPSSAGFDDTAFAAWYGGPLPTRRPVRPFTPDSPVSDMGSTFVGRQAFRIVDMLMAKTVARMSDDMRAMMDEIAADMPLRSFTSGGVSFGVVEGLVDVLNGHGVRGMAKIARGLPKSDVFR